MASNTNIKCVIVGDGAVGKTCVFTAPAPHPRQATLANPPRYPLQVHWQLRTGITGSTLLLPANRWTRCFRRCLLISYAYTSNAFPEDYNVISTVL